MKKDSIPSAKPRQSCLDRCSPRETPREMAARLALSDGVAGMLGDFEKLVGVPVRILEGLPGEKKWCGVQEDGRAQTTDLAAGIRCECERGRACIAAPIQVGRTAMGYIVAGLCQSNHGTCLDGATPRGRPHGGDAAGSLLAVLANELSSLAVKAPKTTPAPHAAIAKAIAIIKSRYSDPALSSNSVSTMVGVSRTHFCELFRQHTGTTFGDLLREYRVERATAMLRDPETKVIDVSYDCGFGSLASMNRAFQRFAGHAPRRRGTTGDKSDSVRGKPDGASGRRP